MIDQFFPTRNEGGPLSVDGAAVCRARREADLTQQQLADRVSQLGYRLTQGSVSSVERGKNQSGFTERMATALASALGVGLTTITGGRLLSGTETQRLHDLTGQIDQIVGSDEGELDQKAE